MGHELLDCRTYIVSIVAPESLRARDNNYGCRKKKKSHLCISEHVQPLFPESFVISLLAMRNWKQCVPPMNASPSSLEGNAGQKSSFLKSLSFCRKSVSVSCLAFTCKKWTDRVTSLTMSIWRRWRLSGSKESKRKRTFEILRGEWHLERGSGFTSILHSCRIYWHMC